MKRRHGLNHWYYTGQTFALDQQTMNQMVADVQMLSAKLEIERCRTASLMVQVEKLEARIHELTHTERSQQPPPDDLL